MDEDRLVIGDDLWLAMEAFPLGKSTDCGVTTKDSCTLEPE